MTELIAVLSRVALRGELGRRGLQPTPWSPADAFLTSERLPAVDDVDPCPETPASLVFPELWDLLAAGPFVLETVVGSHGVLTTHRFIHDGRRGCVVALGNALVSGPPMELEQALDAIAQDVGRGDATDTYETAAAKGYLAVRSIALRGGEPIAGPVLEFVGPAGARALVVRGPNAVELADVGPELRAALSVVLPSSDVIETFPTDEREADVPSRVHASAPRARRRRDHRAAME